MAVEQNLYPPIIPNVMPAFIKTEDCNIYFSLSAYNSVSDIKYVQVSLINQKINKSVLNNNYPLGIKIYSFQTLNSDNSVYQSNINNDYKYYITIPKTDLINAEFETNHFYIIQLRFVSTAASTYSNSAAWLSDNLQYFSEWSTPCLLKCITQPIVQIHHFDNSSVSPTQFFEYFTAVIGKVIFEDGENEYLKSYRITILQEISPNNFRTILQSDQIQTNSFNPNEFHYEFKQDLPINQLCKLSFSYTTNNLYKNNIIYNFTIDEQVQLHELAAIISATPEPENGRIKIDINFNNSVMNPARNLYIKRSSSRTSFQNWEILKLIIHKEAYQNNPSSTVPEDVEHIWYDTSIESGVWYKYRVQEILPNEQYTGVSKKSDIPQPVMCLFEDIFLTQNDKQLKIQFNPTISNLKYNVTESQQITLGSKYPFIKRNGSNFFRSFSIGGLISSFMDSAYWYNPNYHNNNFFYKNTIQTFTSPQIIYEDFKDLYDNYNNENNINNYQDYIYEREFRQKVIDFFYQNNIKLFRSLTEGNMLIKLTDISLQPVNELGRMLYSFSATATEIDDNTLDNYNSYKLLNDIYYCYRWDLITKFFENGESLIQKFFTYSNDNQVIQYPNSIDLIKMIINVNYLKINNIDVMDDLQLILYAKILNNHQFIKYVANEYGQLEIDLTEDTADSVADCFFFGINFNNFIDNHEYYDTFEEINNPVNRHVYYINTEQGYRIDNYESFNNAGILTTYQRETVRNNLTDYDLLVESSYDRYIYYKNSWCLFTKENDILISNINATINYYYRIKKYS